MRDLSNTLEHASTATGPGAPDARAVDWDRTRQGLLGAEYRRDARRETQEQESAAGEREAIQELTGRMRSLEEERRSWQAHWEDVADHMLPRRGRFHDGRQPNEGGKRHGRVVDSTPVRAMKILASGLQGGLTSPSQPWFRLRPAHGEATGDALVQGWLHEVEQVLYTVLARSNFYQAAHGLYIEVAGFGTGALYAEADPVHGLRFKALTAGEYCVDTDQAGRVDTLFRRTRMTVRQMAERFGPERLSDATRRLWQGGRVEERVGVVHAVFPRPDYDPRRAGPASMRWVSAHWEEQAPDRFLALGGYEEFPFFVPRWDVCGDEVYGRSPGMDVLADAKMLQEMNRTVLKALHKEIDPPLRVPAGLSRRVSVLPGAQVPVDVNESDAIAPLYQVRLNIEGVRAQILDVRQAVERGLYNDVFLMIASTGKTMTATETQERINEKLLMLGPVVERLHVEFLDPLLERCLGILQRSGLLPDPPMGMEGAGLKARYVSPLAQAQMLAASRSIGQLAVFAGQLAAGNPEVLDKVDYDRALEEYASAVGVPPRILKPDKDVAAVRQARAEQAQAAARTQQQAAMLRQGVDLAARAREAGIDASALVSTDLLQFFTPGRGGSGAPSGEAA